MLFYYKYFMYTFKNPQRSDRFKSIEQPEEYTRIKGINPKTTSQTVRGVTRNY